VQQKSSQWPVVQTPLRQSLAFVQVSPPFFVALVPNVNSGAHTVMGTLLGAGVVKSWQLSSVSGQSDEPQQCCEQYPPNVSPTHAPLLQSLGPLHESS